MVFSIHLRHVLSDSPFLFCFLHYQVPLAPPVLLFTCSFSSYRVMCCLTLISEFVFFLLPLPGASCPTSPAPGATSSDDEDGYLVAEADQLSSMSLRDLRELLGKVAQLSLTQLQRQQRKQQRQKPVPGKARTDSGMRVQQSSVEGALVPAGQGMAEAPAAAKQKPDAKVDAAAAAAAAATGASRSWGFGPARSEGLAAAAAASQPGDSLDAESALLPLRSWPPSSYSSTAAAASDLLGLTGGPSGSSQQQQQLQVQQGQLLQAFLPEQQLQDGREGVHMAGSSLNYRGPASRASTESVPRPRAWPQKLPLPRNALQLQQSQQQQQQQLAHHAAATSEAAVGAGGSAMGTEVPEWSPSSPTAAPSSSRSGGEPTTANNHHNVIHTGGNTSTKQTQPLPQQQQVQMPSAAAGGVGIHSLGQTTTQQLGAAGVVAGVQNTPALPENSGLAGSSLTTGLSTAGRAAQGSGQTAMRSSGSPSGLLPLLQLLVGRGAGDGSRNSATAAAAAAAGVSTSREDLSLDPPATRVASSPARLQRGSGSGSSYGAATGPAAAHLAAATTAADAHETEAMPGSVAPPAAAGVAAAAGTGAGAGTSAADEGLQLEGLTLDQLTGLLRLCRSGSTAGAAGSPAAVSRSQSVPEVLLQALARLEG